VVVVDTNKGTLAKKPVVFPRDNVPEGRRMAILGGERGGEQRAEEEEDVGLAGEDQKRGGSGKNARSAI